MVREHPALAICLVDDRPAVIRALQEVAKQEVLSQSVALLFCSESMGMSSVVDENTLVDEMDEPLSVSGFSVGEQSASLSTAQILEHQDGEASGRAQDSSAVLYDYQNALSLRLVKGKSYDRRPIVLSLPAVVSDLGEGGRAGAPRSEEHSRNDTTLGDATTAVHSNPGPSTPTVRGVKPLVKKFEAWASTHATQPANRKHATN
jgi:hypothetical protein